MDRGSPPSSLDGYAEGTTKGSPTVGHGNHGPGAKKEDPGNRGPRRGTRSLRSWVLGRSARHGEGRGPHDQGRGDGHHRGRVTCQDDEDEDFVRVPRG